jgi:hypothetical protein
VGGAKTLTVAVEVFPNPSVGVCAAKLLILMPRVAAVKVVVIVHEPEGPRVMFDRIISPPVGILEKLPPQESKPSSGGLSSPGGRTSSNEMLFSATSVFGLLRVMVKTVVPVCGMLVELNI